MANAESATRRKTFHPCNHSSTDFSPLSGHRAADCPSKPPKACKQCGQENPDHEIQDCKVKVIDDSEVPNVSEQEAWLMIKEASVDRDIDDFKDAVKALAKATKYETSYLAIEQECRKRNLVSSVRSDLCPL